MGYASGDWMDEESRAKHAAIIAYANALSTDATRVYSGPMTKPRKRSPARTHIARWVVPAFLVAATLPLYLTFRSISLDDFDSYSFALALGDFDILLQQPQPPGFPVYVAMGRMLFAMLHDPTRALTTLSAFSGAISILLVYGIGREFIPRRPAAAILGAVLFALLPLTWLTAEKALSDMPGVMWTLLAIWLWMRWRRHRTRGHAAVVMAAGAGFTTGLALGVRPQNALPILLLTGEFFITDLIRRRGKALSSCPSRPLGCPSSLGPKRAKLFLVPWVVAGIAGAVAVLLWLVPTASASGGLGVYVSAVRAHSAHVGRADSCSPSNCHSSRLFEPGRRPHSTPC